MNKQLSAALLLCPFLALAGWSMYYMSFTKKAPEVVLPIRGYDPRNLLSGHYIQFQIDWNNADCRQADWNGVCPRADFSGVDRYYVPEDDATHLERIINAGYPVEITFAYQQKMRPVAKKLLINGQPWQEYIAREEPIEMRRRSSPPQILQQRIESEVNYEGRPCHSQEMCGGVNSGYFCNYGGNHTPNRCERTNVDVIHTDSDTFYYNRIGDLRRWCREAYESQSDRDSPGNCNWGYLSYSAARSWCASIGKQLLYAREIETNCDQFSFLPKANPDQQYWTENMTVVHMGQRCSVQDMVRGDGYAWAGGVICR